MSSLRTDVLYNQWMDLKQGAVVYDSINAALSPFRATDVSIEIKENFNQPYRTVVARIKNLPNMVLECPLDFERVNVLDTTAVYEYVAAEFSRQLLVMPRIDPESNLVLGEY